MLNMLVGQFLGSAAGADVLGQLKNKGLDGPAAQAAVTATAEGAMQHLAVQGGGSRGAAGLAGALGGAGGGLGALAGGLLGGGAAPAGGGGATVSAIAAPVVQFVAQKTGLSPSVATMVVNTALPKLMELIQSHGAAKPPPAAGPAVTGGVELPF